MWISDLISLFPFPLVLGVKSAPGRTVLTAVEMWIQVWISSIIHRSASSPSLLHSNLHREKLPLRLLPVLTTVLFRSVFIIVFTVDSFICLFVCHNLFLLFWHRSDFLVWSWSFQQLSSNRKICEHNTLKLDLVVLNIIMYFRSFRVLWEKKNQVGWHGLRDLF